MTRPHANLVLALVGGVGICASLLSLKVLPAPYVWIALQWSVILLVGLGFATKSTSKAVFVNLIVALLVLGTAEVYFWIQDDPFDQSAETERVEGQYAEAYFDRTDDILGYAPVKGISADARTYHGDEIVYDVVYTINSDGLRVSPTATSESSAECILFFGGSFTIGEGVNDDEALPYRVGVISSGRYRVYNFGFHGYGPHQMLAALESGMVSKIVDCSPQYVIYNALDRHVLRTSGQVSWGENAPRYVLNENGGVIRDGTLENQQLMERIAPAIIRQIRKSYIFQRVAGRSVSNRVTETHLRTFGAIVDTARSLILALNKDAEFHVLLWNFDAPLTRRVIEEFEARKIAPHIVLGNILPEADYRESYSLGAYDHHPNAMTYDLIARYVAEHILGESSNVEPSSFALKDSVRRR